MFVRVGATAFLFNGDQVLMMKRAETRAIAPGLWSGVGGHSEPHEINDPLATCFREIFEETGIEEKNIRDLKLRYITLRNYETREIRLGYFYFGRTDKFEVHQTDEGALHWISRAKIAGLEMGGTVQSVIGHYEKQGHTDSKIYIGVMSEKDSVITEWSELGEVKAM